jgi:alpha-beta hydrolase superfamily lysophospholipase
MAFQRGRASANATFQPRFTAKLAWSGGFVNMLRTACMALILALGVAPAFAAPEQHALKRPGGPDIDWYLDRQAPSAKQGILVIAQGSGCGSVANNRNVEAAKGLRPGFAVVTVEKYGVAPGAIQKGPDDCPPLFWAHHTVSQRVEDYRAVIGKLKAEPWWNGKLALFGGSEGGAVVQVLAAQVDADAAVIFSSATGIPFRDAFVQVLPPEVAAAAPAQLEKARHNPLSAETWAGNSYRWWADIADRPLWEEALKAKGALLVVQGVRDRSNPVSSARAFRDRFEAERRTNLTYWEYPDYDHQMVDSAGSSHLPEVLARISGWLDLKLGPDGH